jgi:xylulokinase
VIPCITRCLWFAENMPALWKKTAVTADVHGVLVHFLTGLWTTSTASADPMGLLDMAALDWSDTLLSAVKLNRRQLPALVRPGTVVGEITPAAAKLTGLRAGTPVVAGGGDGQSAGTGTNVFAKGRAYVNLGTALVSGSYGEPYAHHPAFRTLSAVAEKGYIYESCLRSGTFLVNWMAEQMFGARPGKAGPLLDQLTREAARSPIGSKGLVLIPYWSGCMSPYWDSHARGLIAGFTGSHRRGDVFRAVIEGLSLEAVMVADQIAAATEPIDHFVAIGGGARSDLWCQILADVGGRPVARLTTVEASALGAGCAAAKGAGWFATIPQAAAAMAGKPARTFRPKAAAAARYRELAKLQAELWPLLSGWNRRLADFAARNAE